MPESKDTQKEFNIIIILMLESLLAEVTPLLSSDKTKRFGLYIKTLKEINIGIN